MRFFIKGESIGLDDRSVELSGGLQPSFQGPSGANQADMMRTEYLFSIGIIENREGGLKLEKKKH